MHDVRGFTLVEMMVVLVIVSVVSLGAIVLLAPGTRDLEQTEAGRFHALYDLLYEEAMLQGSSRGLAIGQDGYAFFRRVPAGGWEPLDGRPFGPRTLEGDYHFGLLLDGVDVVLDEDTPVNPQLWLSPGGATRPFVLLLRARATGEEIRRFEVDALGRRSWHDRET